MNLQIMDNNVQRAMTDGEYAQWLDQHNRDLANKEAATDAKNARASALAKLEALGLTPAEIAALVGA